MTILVKHGRLKNKMEAAKKTHNERGAGRKALSYQTKRITVPIALLPEIDKLVKQFKGFKEKVFIK